MKDKSFKPVLWLLMSERHQFCFAKPAPIPEKRMLCCPQRSKATLNMTRYIKHLWLPALLLLVLATALIGLKIRNHAMPDVQFHSGFAGSITFADMLPYMTEAAPQSPISREAGTVILTTAALGERMKFTYLSGDFFTDTAVGNGDRVVVVSEAWCIEHRLTTDVLGDTVKIGNDFYTIVGVFAYEQDFFDTCADVDLTNCLYIPYTSVPDWQTLRVTEILTVETPSVELSSLMGSAKTTNLSTMKDYFNALWWSIWIIAAMVVAAFVWKHNHRLPVKISMVALLLVGAVALLALVRIPARYLPSSGNIFEVSHYIDTLAEDIRAGLGGRWTAWYRLGVVQGVGVLVVGGGMIGAIHGCQCRMTTIAKTR